MIKLILGDIWKYDLKDLGKVNYLISSPPFYHENGSGRMWNLGSSQKEHINNTVLKFKDLAASLKLRRTLIQVAVGAFVRIEKKKSKLVSYPVTNLTVDEAVEGAWTHINEQDAYHVVSREFNLTSSRNTFLDPMCGSGTWLKVSSLYFENLIGIDINHHCLELARKKLGMEVKE